MALPRLRRILLNRSPRSDHFNGEQFVNQEPRERKMSVLDWQFNRELDWWQEARLTPDVKVVSTPAHHFSNRGLSDQNGTLWTSYVLQGPSGVTYFAGDTGYGKHFRQVREKFGPPRLAVLPIGAFKPEAFMEVVHVSPKEAVQAHLDLEARVSVPIHYGTFNLADEGQEEPVTELLKAIEAQAEPRPRFWVLGFGEGRDVP
jgi:L-ascorbate metabolism protein UlaG (beta-lactamase superfamily)